MVRLLLFSWFLFPLQNYYNVTRQYSFLISYSLWSNMGMAHRQWDCKRKIHLKRWVLLSPLPFWQPSMVVLLCDYPSSATWFHPLHGNIITQQLGDSVDRKWQEWGGMEDYLTLSILFSPSFHLLWLLSTCFPINLSFYLFDSSIWEIVDKEVGESNSDGVDKFFCVLLLFLPNILTSGSFSLWIAHTLYKTLPFPNSFHSPNSRIERETEKDEWGEE